MITDAIAWALIHSVWQGALIATAFLTVLWITPSPRTRYAAGLASMLALLAAFLLTALWQLPSPAALPSAGFSAVIAVTPATTPPASVSKPPASLAYLPWLWLAGVCACHIWQLAGLLAVKRLRHRGAWPAPDSWNRRLDEFCTTLRVSRPVLLLESIVVRTPLMLGHLRPVILLPAGLLTGLPQQHVEAILLHEIAHVRRWDYLVNLLQRWFEAVFFYHPAIWWISHTVRSEREKCCDDIAAHAVGNPRSYAAALVAVEDYRAQQPALAASGGDLHSRIARLLGHAQPAGVWLPAAMLIATAAVTLAAWQAPEPPNPVYSKWLREDVGYIITPDERAAFARLTTDAEFQAFIANFWLRRGATAKEEHYRRIAYANDRFPESRPGWTTDRGRIYIAQGPPYEIESHPSDNPPYELWRYRDSEPILFAQDPRTGDYRMTRGFVASRRMRWTVTDPQGRFVTGLRPEHFQVTEDGEARTLTSFAGPEDGLAIAIVADAPLSDLPADVYQTRVKGDAVRHLERVPNSRRVLLVDLTTKPTSLPISADIETALIDPAKARPTVVKLRNTYVGSVSAQKPAGDIAITLRLTAGLPPLTINPEP